MTSRVTRSRSQRDLREVEKIDESPNDRKRIASETTQSSSPRGPKRIKRTKDEQYKSRVSSELEVDPASTTRVRNGSKADSTQDATSAAVRIKRTVEEEAEEEEEEEQEAEGTVIRTKRTRKKKVKKDEVVEMKPLATRTHGLRMFIGAHVSAAKGIHNAISNSAHIGGNAFALFLKSQRKWDNPPLETEHRDLFRKYCADHSYDASKYVLPHGSYLVNLAQEDPDKAEQAYTSFMDDLQRCEELGIRIYNFHPGAMNKSTLESSLSRIAKALIKALDSTKTVIPVLETTCGHGTSIGGPLTHFRDLFAMIPKSYHDRLGVCLDTCHTFAAGYDLRTPKGWSAFMEEFDKLIGLKLLRALHLNDSKTPMGSKRDLHANIGTGFLGLRGFHNVMNDRRLEGLPMILETPIDRPAATVKKDNQASDSEAEEASDEETKPPAKGGKKKPAKSARAKPSKPAMVEDKSIWAREIKLLESLIGMDTESEEFLSLERQLADEGREERAKHQALFDKKKAKEGKEKGGKDRSLVDMFSAPATKETAS